ncbi:hypothetical protein RZ760_002730 [Providencia rettgeri]|nr:hypothetical protein [Providencia rettgeri]
MNNKNDINPNMYGSADFENYWNEKLVSVEIIHYMDDLLDL